MLQLSWGPWGSPRMLSWVFKGTLLPRLNILCAWSRSNKHDLQKQFCDWTCHWFYISFITTLFGHITYSNITPISLTPYCIVRSFPMLRFDLTKMSLASQVGRQESRSFAYRSWKKCLWIAIIFVTDCSYLLGVSFWWCILFLFLGSELLRMYFVLISWEWAFEDVLQHSRKNAGLWETVWSIGPCPNLLLTDNAW